MVLNIKISLPDDGSVPEVGSTQGNESIMENGIAMADGAATENYVVLEDGADVENSITLWPEVCVSKELPSVSKTHMEAIVRKMAEVLDSQGVSCFRCPKARYKLYPLSDDWEGKYLCRLRDAADKRFGMAVYCGNGRQVYRFELALSSMDGKEKGE